MEAKLKTAIILGATGLTGGILLKKLLNDERYSKVRLFSRNAIGFSHPKMEEYLGDIVQLKDFKKDFYADEVFCCIGTTKAKTPDSDMYRKIDVGIPVLAAELCKSNGIDTYIVISALGANPKSKSSYNRWKGEMENAVLECGIPKTHFMRPSLISGKREEKRIGEWVANQFMKVLNLVLTGPLDKYRSINPEVIASAMVWLANAPYEQVYIESDQIKKLVGQ